MCVVQGLLEVIEVLFVLSCLGLRCSTAYNCTVQYNDGACDFWEKRNQCWTNPRYMMYNCAKACKSPALCFPDLGDLLTYCPDMAHLGQCSDPVIRDTQCPHTCAVRAAAPQCPSPELGHMAAILEGKRDVYHAYDRVRLGCPLAITLALTYYNKVTNFKLFQACDVTGQWRPDLPHQAPICAFRREDKGLLRPNDLSNVTLTVVTSTKALSAISCLLTCYESSGCRYFALWEGSCYALKDGTSSDVITLPRKEVWERQL